jgi:hypothetical protein
LLSTSGNLIAGTHIGKQNVSGLSGADAGNYSFAAVVGDYTVNKLALTGSVTAANKTYDSTNSATITSRSLTGAVAGDAVGYTGGTATFSDQNAAVAKTVTATGLGLSGGDAGNYTVNATALTMADITAAALTIQANDASRPFGVPNPPFSATYTGFVGGETPVVLTGAISFTTPATVFSPAGPYAIVPSGQTSTNYSITYVNGTLLVGMPGPGFAGNGNLPTGAQDVALQRLGFKTYAELWKDCVGGGSASSGGGVASSAQLACAPSSSANTESVDLPQAAGL